MTTIGVIYAVSRSAGESCFKCIEKILINYGERDYSLIFYEKNLDKYKKFEHDLNKLAILLKESLDKLVDKGAEVIVIAANSVHRAFKHLKKMMKTEAKYNNIVLLNIVEETIKECKKKVYKNFVF